MQSDSATQTDTVTDGDGDKVTLKDTVIKIFEEIDDLTGEIAAMKHPSGAKNNPGRTCYDIHLGHPQLADGLSWLHVFSFSFCLPATHHFHFNFFLVSL